MTDLIASGTVIFAGTGGNPEWEELSIADAKAYCKTYNLTAEQIKIVRHEGQILVVTKKPVELKK